MELVDGWQDGEEGAKFGDDKYRKLVLIQEWEES